MDRPDLPPPWAGSDDEPVNVYLCSFRVIDGPVSTQVPRQCAIIERNMAYAANLAQHGAETLTDFMGKTVEVEILSRLGALRDCVTDRNFAECCSIMTVLRTGTFDPTADTLAGREWVSDNAWNQQP